MDQWFQNKLTKEHQHPPIAAVACRVKIWIDGSEHTFLNHLVCTVSVTLNSDDDDYYDEKK